MHGTVSAGQTSPGKPVLFTTQNCCVVVRTVTRKSIDRYVEQEPFIGKVQLCVCVYVVSVIPNCFQETSHCSQVQSVAMITPSLPALLSSCQRETMATFQRSDPIFAVPGFDCTPRTDLARHTRAL